jgi:hypothetical protein
MKKPSTIKPSQPSAKPVNNLQYCRVDIRTRFSEHWYQYHNHKTSQPPDLDSIYYDTFQYRNPTCEYNEIQIVISILA